MQPLVVFSHGKETGPKGRKITCLSTIAEELGFRVMSLDYQDLPDPDARVKRLLETDLGDCSSLVLAGSSMGGYVAAVAAKSLRPSGLFLMAPAFYLPGYRVQRPRARARRTMVVAGWNDEVVPVDSSIRFARETRAELHLFDSDHVLSDILPEVGQLFRRLLYSVR